MTRTSRRGLACLAAAFVLAPRVAHAGAYLERVALLLEASRVEREAAVARPSDRELLVLLHATARARNEAARGMPVPRLVEQAHPHLLLVLENTERALAAGIDRQLDKFSEYVQRARGEERAFRNVVAKLGYTLPG